jgi:antibiotic biosynthesis monooxygenase (ABM) superfamily enzyme
MNTLETGLNGATVVITQRVSEEHVGAYENWLKEIQPICQAYPGHLDSQVIRPIAGLTGTYTFIIRFDTIHNLRNWIESQDRKRLLEKAWPMLLHGDSYAIRSGLDFWFTPTGEGVKVPSKWKQTVLTCSVIYPLVLLVPRAVAVAIREAGLSVNGLLAAFIGTLTICVLMTYVIMPHYTKLMRRWLYSEGPLSLADNR